MTEQNEKAYEENLVKKLLVRARDEGFSQKDVNILENCFKQCGYREPRENKEILVVRIDNIGDFVIQSGFLRELRRCFPNERITLVVSEKVKEIAFNCPYVNQVIVFEYTRGEYDPEIIKKVADFVLKNDLLDRYFDMSFCTQDGTDSHISHLIAYFTGANIRFGFSHNGANLLLTNNLPEYAPLPEYKKPMNLIRMTGNEVHNEKPELWFSYLAHLSIHEKLREYTDKLNKFKNIIFLCTDSSRPIFMYSYYNKVVEELKDYLFIIVGKNDTNEISGYNVISLVNETTLQELCALPSSDILRDKKKLCVSNNTGVIHIMAANGIPCVQLCVTPKDRNEEFMTSDLKRFPPAFVPSIQLQPEHSLKECKDISRYPLCGADKPHCINQIKPQEVIEAIKTLTNVSLYI